MKLATERRTTPANQVPAEAVAGLTQAETARLLGVGRSTVFRLRKRLGLPTDEAARVAGITAAVVALTAAGRTAPDIAAALGLAPVTVYRYQRATGSRPRRTRSAPRRWTPAELDLVRTAPTAQAAAAALRVSRDVVRFARRVRLGIPAMTPSERGRHAQACWTASRAELCRSYNLPADLTPHGVSVVLYLLDGPATRAEVFAAFRGGVEYAKPAHCPALKHLERLVRRGLVACVPLPPPHACRGGCRRAYLLSPVALDMLAAPGVSP